ncbi:MAG: ArsC family reductase [Betaproteobacteria bacterium]|nr:ArsC family reductase [Betaproteobacteria bacterium]
MKTTLYGIKNCDTIKKARSWLAANKIDYDFHDYKTEGVEEAKLERWCRECGWEVVLNRAGTTFRALPEADKQVSGAKDAIKLMMSQTSMIKRPVLEHHGEIVIGFKPEIYAQYFSK